MLMKTMLSIFVCVCLFGPVQAKYKSLWSELQEGDWMNLEYIQYVKFDPSVDFEFNNVNLVEFKATVLKKKDDLLQVSFKPFHLYQERDGDYDGYHCFDSFFSLGNDFSEKKDSVVILLNASSHIVSDTTYFIREDYWSYRSMLMPYKLNDKSNRRYSYSEFGLSPKDIFKEVIDNCFREGQQDELPLVPEKKAIQVKVTDASFQLPPNVRIRLSSPAQVNQDSCKLSLNFPEWRNLFHENWMQIRQDKDGILFECFIPQPVSGELKLSKSVQVSLPKNKIPFLLCPGDSIQITLDSKGEVSYTGKGSVNCKFWLDWQMSMISTHDLVVNPDKKSVTQYQEFTLKRYQTLWNKYAAAVSPYWLKSSQLSYQYEYITTMLSVQKRMPQVSGNVVYLVTSWEKLKLPKIRPFIDYLYQPFDYSDYSLFLNVFSGTKREELEQNMLIRFDPVPYSSPEQYYLIKSLFSGYPKYFLLAENLKDMMKDKPFSYSQREYEDFKNMYNCPQLLQQIEKVRQVVSAVEPGKNIRDLHLKTEKYIPLDKSGEHYILLNFGNSVAFGIFRKRMEYMNPEIKDKFKFCFIQSSENMDKLTEEEINSPDFIFVDKQDVLSDLNTLREQFYYRKAVFLIRSDGTILSKSLQSGSFGFDEMIQLIREDMNRPQESKSELFSVVFLSILISIPLTIVLSLVLSKVIRRSKLRKEENKRLISELKLKAIRSQMNPHFIFNALSSIQHLINQGKNKEANNYLLNFAKLLRSVLDTSDKKLIPLSEEIEQIDLYLKMEQLRVPFHYLIQVDENIRQNDESIPGMLIQPIVENAVIHGITPQKGGNITIHFSMEDNILRAEISDDGPGFNTSENHNGFGLRATQERLEIVNRELKTTIGIKIEDNIPRGTKVTISIPI